MSQFVAAKSDQLTAEDLVKSGPRTITVTRVIANEGNAEQPVSIFFEGDEGKPWRPCKTTRRVMVRIWGPDARQYAGRSLTLFCDPKVKFGGLEVGGIRISHMSHMDGAVTMGLLAAKSKMQGVTIKPLAAKKQPPATVAKTGPEPQGEPAEVAAAGSEEVAIADVAAEVVAKFKAATTVELIDAAWRMSAADRRACVDADASYADVFLAEFKKAKTALQDEVPA